MADHPVRKILTPLGSATSHPAAFLIVLAYAALGDDTGTACRWYCRRIDHCVQLAESGLYLVDSHRCTMGIAPQCRLAYDCVDV